MKLSGFSLLEIALVILIIAIMSAGVLKGKSILDNVKLDNFLHTIQSTQQLVLEYRETYGYIPGDDPEAQQKFNVPSGNGNNLIDGNDAQYFWQHLYHAGKLKSPRPPQTKFSTTIMPMSNSRGNFLIFSGVNGSGALTPKQAQTIKNKLNEPDPDIGDLIIDDVGGCLNGKNYNITNNNYVCIVLAPF